KAFIGSIGGMVTTILLLALIFIVPVLGPLVSCKELALKLDRLMKPDESIKFYRKARASFLFYTDRTAEVLENPQQLKNYMGRNEKVYCVFKYDDWEDIENLHNMMQVIAQVEDKLIVSNRKN
ncbi:MAG: hypothetical protein P8X85_07430, partial [Desulfobacterales bacterium]